ncbi:MAG: energy transducer TonB, partial [Bacteroidota bacterium]
VEKDKLPDNKPETPATTAATSSNNSNLQTGGNDGGIPAGNGNVITVNDVRKEIKPEFYDIKTVEQMPEFIGGQPAFEEFVQDNIVYPVDEKLDGVEGTVRIQFIVTEDGILQNISLYKSSGNRNLDKEALRLVKSLPKYKPGKQNGVAVKVFCVLPIHFLIE